MSGAGVCDVAVHIQKVQVRQGTLHADLQFELPDRSRGEQEEETVQVSRRSAYRIALIAARPRGSQLSLRPSSG